MASGNTRRHVKLITFVVLMLVTNYMSSFHKYYRHTPNSNECNAHYDLLIVLHYEAYY